MGYIFGSGPRGVTSPPYRGNTSTVTVSGGVMDVNTVAVMIGAAVMLLHVGAWVYSMFRKR